MKSDPDTRTKRIAALLAVDAEIEPPAALDGRIRKMLAAPGPKGAFHVSPSSAAALALASLVALLTGLTAVLSQSSVDEGALILATLLLSAYLVVCGATTVPLWLLRSRRHPATAVEVQT